MTEQEVTRSLRLIRYGGVVVTITVAVVLVAFAVVVGNATTLEGFSGMLLSQLLPYIIGFTVLAAVLSIILYFAYRARLMSMMKK